jgi:Ca2+-binding EF-hand superfamily protein
VYKGLAQFSFTFFEFNSKVYDEMKSEEYKQLMDILITASPRVWSVFAFRYWDSDQNGLICSNDIFRKYKELDEMETLLSQQYTTS